MGAAVSVPGPGRQGGAGGSGRQAPTRWGAWSPEPAALQPLGPAAGPPRGPAGRWGRHPQALAPFSTASPSGVLVMKSCAPTCPNSTVTSNGVALSVSCCQDSQCHSSAAAGLRGGPGALGATAAASLLWVLLRAAC